MNAVPLPEYRSTSSSNHGSIIHVPYSRGHVDPALTADTRLYDAMLHTKEVHAPVALRHPTSSRPGAWLESRGTCLEGPYLDCLDLPIRLAGQDDYAIPFEWHGLLPVITDILLAEHANNPGWRDYNAYLTVHFDADLPEGAVQRNPGAHTDGFQSDRHGDAKLGARNYVLVTNGGTLFYPRLFLVPDPDVFNIFEGFDLQLAAEPEDERTLLVGAENQVFFFDGYAVHEAGATSRRGSRLFLRVAFETLRFDRAANTHNAMLDYEWEPYHGDRRETLLTPTWDDLRD